MIRPESPADAAAIQAVTAAAFRDVPHAGHNEQHIVDALRAAGALSLSLVAEEAGAIVGHVAASSVAIEDGSAGWYGIGPLSVRPDRQRVGIGSALMREALHRLRERGAAGCVLVGNPAYYGRFGFRSVPGLVYPGVADEYVLVLAFDAPLPRGVVTYHAAFQARETSPED